MPKAGSTFMRRFLEFYFGRDNIIKKGIHNGIKLNSQKRKIDNGDFKVISTIRNPFDWYVSLFTWNSLGKGIYSYIGLKRNELSMDGFKSIIKNPAILFRDLSEWRDVFDNPKSAKHFQKWLKLILEKQPHFVEREFGLTSKHIGFCTYRFLQVHSFNFYNNYSLLMNSGSATEYYKHHKLPIIFLRTESMVDDLLKNMHSLGLEEKKVIDTLELMSEKKLMRANSTQRLPYDYYYNQESIDLIYKKDKFILDLFKYEY